MDKRAREGSLTDVHCMEPVVEPVTTIERLDKLPNNSDQNWLKDPGLRRLNLGIVFLFFSSAGTGYNGSVINGLQVLPECEDPPKMLT